MMTKTRFTILHFDNFLSGDNFDIRFGIIFMNFASKIPFLHLQSMRGFVVID